jgi:hypothetical protein
MTPSEIESTTFRLLALCLNQLRHQQRANLISEDFFKTRPDRSSMIEI